jgi:hypothetical protein
LARTLSRGVKQPKKLNKKDGYLRDRQSLKIRYDQYMHREHDFKENHWSRYSVSSQMWIWRLVYLSYAFAAPELEHT